MADYAEILKNIRKSSGKSQDEFAKELEISQRTWSNYENGQTRPKLGVLIALEAKGYKIDGLYTSPFQEMIDKGKATKEEVERRLQIARMVSPDMDAEQVAQVIAAADATRHPPTPLSGSLQIPILRQKVSCGPGETWESEENIEKYIDVHTLIPRLEIGRVFAIKAKGSSMLGAGIKGGDYLLFNTSDDEALNDGIYVFALDGDIYCKRLEFDRLAKKVNIFSVRVSDLEKVELVTSIDTSDVSFSDRFRIFGKVTRSIHLIQEEE